MARNERQKKLLEGQRETVGIYFAMAKGFFEQIGVRRKLADARYDVAEGFMHFNRIFNWHQRLLSQRAGASVPEKSFFPGEVEKRHGVAGSGLSFGAATDSRTGIGERSLALMTGGARLRSLDRESFFRKQAAPQLDSFDGQRIVARQIRHRKLRRKSESIRTRGRYS